MVFEFSEKEGTRWIPFTPSRSKFVYHADQGWSGVLDIPMGNRNHRVTAGFAFGNNDDLIEEYSGFRFALREPEAGHRAARRAHRDLGFNQTWQDPTLLALAVDPGIPEPYRERLTVEPSVTFALTPFVRVTGGASISELESLSNSPASQMANAVLARVDYDQRWYQPRVTQRVEASYELRSATEALESDLIYKRHLGEVRYRVHAAAEHRHRPTSRSAASPATRRSSSGSRSATRRRCAAGTSTTSRRPAAIASCTSRSSTATTRVGLFLDAARCGTRTRRCASASSTGFGVHGDNAFVTLAFPLNADDLGVTFMMGVRF